MTSSEQKQNEIESERVAGNTRIVETELRCTYPNERRERNQIYTLLSISNSINEQEERSLDCTNGTGWEEAVQGWGKTAPFAYLQLQKKARKAKTSESVSGCQSVSGCLYCLDLNQVIDKSLEQDPKGTEPLKTDFKLITCAATDRIPEKQQTLLLQSATIDYSATEDSKKENCYGKIYTGQTSQGEKKKVSLKDAQATLSERRFFLMKESPLFQGEKRTVPIKEYSILTTGKPKTLETVKYKDTKGYEPPICNHVGTETATVKPSLVLPPLKDATLKTTLDPSAKKSKTVTSQASEKSFHAISETSCCGQVFKTKEQKSEKRIDTMYNAVKEQIKMHEIASFDSRLSKTSFISRNPDRCYWHCAFAPDTKMATMSNSIALRRHNHLNSMHFLHTKGARINKANEMQDPCTRSRSHTGTKQGNESKTQEIPLLSGLFPSLTEQGWGRATPFTCCKIQKETKKPRVTKTVSSISHQNMVPANKKNMAWVTQLARERQKTDSKFTEGEPVSSNKKIEVSCIKPYNYVPMMTAHAEGDRKRGKLDSIQTFLGEKRSLPIKEYEIKYSQRQTEPDILKYNEIGLPRVIHGNPPNSLSCITLNAFLVFRPDEGNVINLHLEPPSKHEATAVKRTEEEDSTDAVSYSHVIKKVKQKSEKKVGMNNTVKKQIQKSCIAL
ncbi:Uncharacterized protein PODLI_1B026258 [Podarcis lilfordi]|uniref:Uncharacterized protein n=1 Tax=Podarcis lilfordi TaxID=74358 RepID=A0AA35KRA0_9SAUR|nr:Uncharacterized protein PODLI_1B026258 [Podarcis lilfordi]